MKDLSAQLGKMSVASPVSFSDLYSAFAAFEQQAGAGAGAGAGGQSAAQKSKSGGAQKKPAAAEKAGGAAAKKDKESQKDKGGAKKEKKGKGGNNANNAKKAEVVVDVSILDIRVGKIVEVKPHPDADGLYLEQIDVGEEKPRQVVSGLRKFVAIEDMQDREVVVILNLKPAKMRGVMSNGMVLCASNDDHTEVEPLCPPAGVPYGEKLSFEGFTGEPLEVINPKKKMLEKLFPDLKTNADGVAKYKDAVFTTTKGVCKSRLTNAWVK